MRTIDIEKAYDEVAGKYAETFAGEHEEKPMDQEMLRRFSGKIGSRRPVWDFGCGPGQTAGYLKELGVEISGMDLSGKMIEEARRLHPDIHFQRGNILELECASDSIAGVVAFYSIVHFTEGQVAAAFRGIFRVLEPGGMVLLTYHVGTNIIDLDEFLGRRIDIDLMFFSSAFISRCLRDSGFKEVEIIEREPYPGVEYQSRRAYAFAVKPFMPICSKATS